MLLNSFFTETASTEISTLSLHDALPIWEPRSTPWTRTPPSPRSSSSPSACCATPGGRSAWRTARRSEEHTSELQSRLHLVCRLLLEKKINDGLEGAQYVFVRLEDITRVS